MKSQDSNYPRARPKLIALVLAVATAVPVAPLTFAGLAVLPAVANAATPTTGYQIQTGGQITFSASNTSWADLHFIVNNGPQQNVRMTQNGTNSTYVVSGLPANASVRFFLYRCRYR